MTSQWSVDRFEGDRKQLAVLVSYDNDQVTIPRRLLPRGVQPGDVLTLTIARDDAATRALSEEARRVRDELHKADPGGDLAL